MAKNDTRHAYGFENRFSISSSSRLEGHAIALLGARIQNRHFLESFSARTLIGVIVIMAVFCFFPGLDQKTHWASHEARHGQIAKEMVLTGNYLVPYHGHAMYVDKPPFYHWLAAGFSKLLHRTDELPMRMPSAIFAIFGALGVFAIGNRLYGKKTGFVASVILICTAIYYQWAVMARMDMVMTGLLVWVGAFTVFGATTPKPVRRWGFAAAAGLSLAAATMTKGLPPLAAGLLIMTVLLYCLPIRKRNIPFFLAIAFGLTAVFLLGWFALISGSGFMEGFIRFQTGGTGPKHQRSVFYYLLNPQIFLPWTFWMPFAAWDAWKEWRQTHQRVNAIPLVVSAGLLLFFTLFGNKRGHYLLPMVPFTALLLSRFFLSAFDKIEDGNSRTDRLIRWPLLAILALMPVLGLAAIFSQKGDLSMGFSAVAAGFLLLTLLTVSSLRNRYRRNAPALMAHLVLAIALMWGGIFPAAASFYWKPEPEIRIAGQINTRINGKVPIGIGNPLSDAIAFGMQDRIPVLLENTRSVLNFASERRNRYLVVDKDTADRVQALLPGKTRILGQWNDEDTVIILLFIHDE